VTVIGKTDRVGSATANLALSQRRADQVRDALVAAGVPAVRIDTRWTGEGLQQVATGDDIDEQRNRVVDITVVQQPR
jgi:OOP family OmpA-OmpF porin